MVYDLQGEASMSPIVGILYSAVKENNQRLQLITDGMSQEEVDYKGQLLPQSLKEQYGPMIDANNRLPIVKGKSLNTLMSNYGIHRYK